MPHTFVLNDEKKKNSYGFRTLNSGINMERFKNNPVLLDDHVNSTRTILGKWVNIRIDGSLLKADAEFDEGDEQAMKVKGKVERGYLKGCSMGLDIMAGNFEKEPSGEWVLTKSELMESSVCAVPSNANAVKLFGQEGKEITKQEIQLKLSNKGAFPIQSNMNKLNLAAITLAALGLQNAEDLNAVSLAVEKMVKEKEDLIQENVKLQGQIDSHNSAKSEAIVLAAIAEGKLTADMKEAWVKLANQDLDNVEKTLQGMPGKKSLAAMAKGGNPTELNEEQFFKLSVEEQIAWKEENPEAYQKLFA